MMHNLLLPDLKVNQHLKTWRSSVAGETASMLLIVHALFTLAAWLTFYSHLPVAWMLCPSAGWLILRSCGYGLGAVWTNLATLFAAVSTGYAGWSSMLDAPSWLRYGPFSCQSISLALCIIFLADLYDVLRNIRWNFVLQNVSLRYIARLFRARFLSILVLTLLASYLVVLPVIETLLQQLRKPDPLSRVIEELTIAEVVRLRVMEVITAMWFFALGATLGSYLNVVVYRIPRRESLIWKRSTCPRCQMPIAFRDNIPVFGWISLNGKCRSCALPIAARYPLVEGLTGVIFLLFYFVELLSGGLNLPERTPNSYTGVIWIIFYTKWDLVRLYLYHCLLLAALLAWSLIRYDKQSVPFRAFCTTFMLAAVPLAIWPHLAIVPCTIIHGSTWTPTPSAALIAAGFGGIIGVASALITSLILQESGHDSSRKWIEQEFVAGVGLAGLMLGYQAALSTLSIALLLRLVQRRLTRVIQYEVVTHWPLAGLTFLATILQLLTWRFQAQHLAWHWPVTQPSLAAIVIWLIIWAILTFSIRSQTPAGTSTIDTA